MSSTAAGSAAASRRVRSAEGSSEVAVGRWAGGAVAFCFGYAVLRYNVFKGVEWAHLPLYVANKALALSAVVLVAASYFLGGRATSPQGDCVRRARSAKRLGLTGFSLAALHALMSMTLLSPVYFEKLHSADGKLTLAGEAAMLFGVLSLWCLTLPALASLPAMNEHLGTEGWSRMQRMGYWALALNCGHVLAMGASGWLDLAGWPGGLPPITLPAFVVGLAALLTKMIRLTATARR